MKTLELNTGLFPDAQTVNAALRRMDATYHVDSIDLRRRDLEEDAWDRILDAILASDMTITV
jgi:hypothetical protein